MKTYSIGRSSSNDICYVNENVSRQHAEIICADDGTYQLTDHSKNGTTVNGRPVHNTTIPIQYGDNVQFAGAMSLDWSKIQPFGDSTSYNPAQVQPIINIAPPAQQAGNGMAVAGFVLSFIFPVLGIIFSGVGLSRANARPDQKGRGLAIAGLVISIINLIIAVLIKVLLL